ncbi:seryl-tRNA synthetase [Paenibacillus phyllosphaerae]|uniref:Serine--tRNA ligase n=1 Tax=Paenibacillus phyllosphaerae TaxID=274593 RepID=A0A7W5AWX4_9BACL|nr:serine--tRNA ligase [Paenibacillus phyllosphaerae]MBB3110310.1 seryl-tRNA synthetase [Paenibacillus phyllosphaerae]
MLDIRTIREQADAVQDAADRKGLELDVGALIRADEERRNRMGVVEQLRAERNACARQVAQLAKEGRHEEAEVVKQEASRRNVTLAREEELLKQVEAEYEELMLYVPNFYSPDTPIGASDADNVEVRRVGEQPQFEYAAKDHVALGEELGLIDLERGVKIAGSRHYVLQGAGQLLHRAVQQLALDLLADEGYTLFEVPMMAREETFYKTGFFPAGKDQAYALEGEKALLAGTAEVPLVALYGDEVLDLHEPLRLGAASSCFRSEVGKAGKDVHGLYRVHQFAKVEQVVICQANEALAEQMLQQILGNAERLLQLLELPYRVVAVCTGDLSQKNYKQYDVETWMPSRGQYGETHSASSLLDFQARRSRIRYRDEEGKLRFAYTLNNTMVATPRILIPLLENHQREDGSIHIPEALRPYMRGLQELR